MKEHPSDSPKNFCQGNFSQETPAISANTAEVLRFVYGFYRRAPRLGGCLDFLGNLRSTPRQNGISAAGGTFDIGMSKRPLSGVEMGFETGIPDRTRREPVVGYGSHRCRGLSLQKISLAEVLCGGYRGSFLSRKRTPKKPHRPTNIRTSLVTTVICILF